MFGLIFFLRKKKISKTFKKRLKEILGYNPRNFRLYEIALIHKSASLRLSDGSLVNNERLEFLGDAVLSAIIAEYLFFQYPNKNEGFLTEMRSKIVNRDMLNDVAMKIKLDSLVISKVNDNTSQNLKGDAFEALLGAMFIDRGFKRTKKFIEGQFLQKFVDLKHLQKTETNFKSKIIEWSQKNKQDISFESFEESTNKSKNTPVFISHLMVLDKVLGTGKGNSKKEAEQKAAKEALSNIKKYF